MTDESWKSVLLFLLSMLKQTQLKNKSYCKRHLKRKMVEFFRCILPYVPFPVIIKAADNHTDKKMRFKAIKELVNDIFSDKSNEWSMCMWAKVN